MKKIIKCGITGWCLEILWTSLGALRRREMKLIGSTSIWMFPIYGCAAFLGPVSRMIRKYPLLLRGSIYSGLIMTGEFLSGAWLARHNMCPWDYSKAKYNYKGLVRADYFPVWFLTGLLYEQLLKK